MSNAEIATLIVAMLLAGAIAWLIVELRTLRDEARPVLDVADSPLVQALAGIRLGGGS